MLGHACFLSDSVLYYFTGPWSSICRWGFPGIVGGTITISTLVSCTDQTRSDRVFLICTLRYKVNFIEKLLWKMFVPLFVDWVLRACFDAKSNWLHEFWKVLEKFCSCGCTRPTVAFVSTSFFEFAAQLWVIHSLFWTIRNTFISKK